MDSTTEMPAGAQEALDASLARLGQLQEAAAGTLTDDEMDEFTAEVEKQIAAKIAAADPRRQQYIRRWDNNTVVTSDAEYERCQKGGVPMGLISYTQAIALLDQEKAVQQAIVKKKQKRKAVKQARRRNRGR